MMADLANEPDAVQIISDILQELHIVQVVYIDDGFEIVQNVEAAIGWFYDALKRSPEEAQVLLNEVNFSIPDEGWVADFREVWGILSNDRRTTIVAGLSRILGEYITQDLQFAAKLNNLFPERINIIELSPAGWEQSREVLVGETSTEQVLLCLFDQDLHQANGYTETGSRSGVGLLKDLVATYPEASIICGLLTHTLSPASEIDAWHRFAAEQDLRLAQFLPIAKDRLNDPLSFATAIKKTTLNVYFEKMKEQAINILTEANAKAAEDFANIDVYDFEYIVLLSSTKEGVSESETLLRLYQIFHQDRVKQLLLAEGNATNINESVERARKLSGIAEKLRVDRADQRWELRHQEIYESEDLVNPFHSPLQTGDLFSVVGKDEKKFLLLAQPCDLMVRSDGSRGKYGSDKVAVLVPLERRAYKSGRNLKFHELVGKGVLKYLYKGSNDVGLAAFNQPHMIRLDVLDLAVLNRDGTCHIRIPEEDTNIPPQFHQAWRARWPLLYSIFRGYADNIDSLTTAIESIEDKDTRKRLADAVVPKMWLSSLEDVEITYSDRSFDFGLRRVGRLRQPWANHLLNMYTRYLSREAEEYDFS